MQRLKLSEFWVPTTRSETVWFASKQDKNQPLLRLRLVEVRQGKTMYGYITSVLDPQFFHRMPLLTSTDDGGELKRLSILNACIKLFVDWFD